jgi:hypothetical protein
MRFIVASALLLASCARIQLNTSEMTPEQILQRSTHVFIGVVEKQELANRFLFRASGGDAGKWRVFRTKVRVETVLRGEESRPVIDIYEVFPTGVLTGDWNSTQDNGRYLFPVHLEDGRYHVVRDFWRSIYPVYSGRHDRLPLDDSRPFWERFALLQWWVKPDRSPEFGLTSYNDPALVFGRWREVKVLRGLLRHPDRGVRLAACEDLLHMGWAQDECWDLLESTDRQSLKHFWNMVPPEQSWNENRGFEKDAHRWWDNTAASDNPEPSSRVIDELRLFTTINNSALRREFCVKFRRKFPVDRDNGCPANRPPPATIVTKDGDIPLVGEWPTTVQP